MSSEPSIELHVVSRRSDLRAWQHCRARVDTGSAIEVVLIHDAVLETETSLAEAFGTAGTSELVVMACADDAKQRRVEERWALIDYVGIIERCAAARQVTSW